MAQHDSLEGIVGMSSDDREELEKLLSGLADAASKFESAPDNEDQQCSICLLTRAAYTEFYSLSELRGEIDEDAAGAMKILFGRILDHLPEGGRYYNSVKRRSEEFDAYCLDLAARDECDTEVTMQ